MSEHNRRLLRALKDERDFFQAGGYGRPFRSEWRPTLFFRDSPVCFDFSDPGALHPCRQCPLFSLVPAQKRNSTIPCHHIVLDIEGNTIAQLYQCRSQSVLDRIYCDWLANVIAGLEKA